MLYTFCLKNSVHTRRWFVFGFKPLRQDAKDGGDVAGRTRKDIETRSSRASAFAEKLFGAWRAETIMKINKRITDTYCHTFAVEKSGLAAISVSARCQSKKQLKSNTDEDLRVEIDGFGFREIPPEKNIQQYNIPASFNGSKLKGLKKTVVFFVMLKKGEHTIDLIPKPSAFVEKIAIQEFKDSKNVTLPFNEQAEDGDRRPWFAFVLVHASLKLLTLAVDAQYRLGDSDDIKVIIDNNIQKQEHSYLHRFWAFAGSLLKKIKQKKEEQEKTFSPNLSKARHYIEIWADRTPTLHSIALEIDPVFSQDAPKEPEKRIPTVDDPEWTGDFHDDIEEMLMARLIFGEARNEPRAAKERIAWSVVNRTEAGSWWPNTIQGAILQKGQYDPFKAKDSNYDDIIDPLRKVGQKTKAAWQECYAVASEVMARKTKNPTPATHFHGIGVTRDWFEKHVVPQGRFLEKIGNTSFYWSPN